MIILIIHWWRRGHFNCAAEALIGMHIFLERCAAIPQMHPPFHVAVLGRWRQFSDVDESSKRMVSALQTAQAKHRYFASIRILRMVLSWQRSASNCLHLSAIVIATSMRRVSGFCRKL